MGHVNVLRVCVNYQEHHKLTTYIYVPGVVGRGGRLVCVLGGWRALTLVQEGRAWHGPVLVDVCTARGREGDTHRGKCSSPSTRVLPAGYTSDDNSFVESSGWFAVFDFLMHLLQLRNLRKLFNDGQIIVSTIQNFISRVSSDSAIRNHRGLPARKELSYLTNWWRWCGLGYNYGWYRQCYVSHALCHRCMKSCSHT